MGKLKIILLTSMIVNLVAMGMILYGFAVTESPYWFMSGFAIAAVNSIVMIERMKRSTKKEDLFSSSTSDYKIKGFVMRKKSTLIIAGLVVLFSGCNKALVLDTSSLEAIELTTEKMNAALPEDKLKILNGAITQIIYYLHVKKAIEQGISPEEIKLNREKYNRADDTNLVDNFLLGKSADEIIEAAEELHNEIEEYSLELIGSAMAPVYQDYPYLRKAIVYQEALTTILEYVNAQEEAAGNLDLPDDVITHKLMFFMDENTDTSKHSEIIKLAEKLKDDPSGSIYSQSSKTEIGNNDNKLKTSRKTESQNTQPVDPYQGEQLTGTFWWSESANEELYSFIKFGGNPGQGGLYFESLDKSRDYYVGEAGEYKRIDSNTFEVTIKFFDFDNKQPVEKTYVITVADNKFVMNGITYLNENNSIGQKFEQH